MDTQSIPSPPKRTSTWASEVTYHSIGSDDEIQKNFISEDNADNLGGTREKPKIALTKRFSLLHPLVHLLPVGVTISIVQLSFREVYWDDEVHYDARWQAVLQFPAKLHEILIVGSLSAIVLQ